MTKTTNRTALHPRGETGPAEPLYSRGSWPTQRPPWPQAAGPSCATKGEEAAPQPPQDCLQIHPAMPRGGCRGQGPGNGGIRWLRGNKVLPQSRNFPVPSVLPKGSASGPELPRVRSWPRSCCRSTRKRPPSTTTTTRTISRSRPPAFLRVSGGGKKLATGRWPPCSCGPGESMV